MPKSIKIILISLPAYLASIKFKPNRSHDFKSPSYWSNFVYTVQAQRAPAIASHLFWNTALPKYFSQPGHLTQLSFYILSLFQVTFM